MPKDQWRRANNRARYGPAGDPSRPKNPDDAERLLQKRLRKLAKREERRKALAQEGEGFVEVLACRPCHIRRIGENTWRAYITVKPSRLALVMRTGRRLYLRGDGWEMKILDHFTKGTG